MNIDYMGVDIQFLEFNEKWRIDQQDFPTLAAAKAHIDMIFKEKRKITDTPIIVLRGWKHDRFTAVAQRWDGPSIWVKKSNGKRTKVPADQVLLDDATTRAALKEIDDLRLRATALMDEAADMEKAIPRLQR